MTLIQHTSKSNEHYTPDYILEPSRKLLGGIDLDPASSSIANDRVKATRYYTKEDNALREQTRWHGRVFLNPPGGKAPGIPSMQKAFWYKLIDEYLTGGVEEAIFLAFSIELLQTSQNGQDNPAYWCSSYPFCIPRKRIAYIDQNGNPQKSPPNASAIVYLPPSNSGDLISCYEQFIRLFSSIGHVVIPSKMI